ncbi:beta-1-4-N-acetylgalactosaminyltransferase bre-4-like, partial [Brachionus plicatilis]
IYRQIVCSGSNQSLTKSPNDFIGHSKCYLKLFKKFRFILILVVFVTVFTAYFSNEPSSSKNSTRIDIKKSLKVESKNLSKKAMPNEFTDKNVTKTVSNSSIDSSFSKDSNVQLGICPLIPPNLGARIQIDYTNRTIAELEHLIAKNQPDLEVGGKWKPKECMSRNKVALIVPYRDRLLNLQLFLNHMHPFLKKQQIEYGIYLVEPVENITFNRGLLMNIGYAEAVSESKSWECFVFHDVDLLPEDERNIYSCPETPRHMSSAVSTLKYKLPYAAIFGGVTEFTKDQFEKINGFSNLFFGWGGEDDDLRKRVVKKGYTVSRYPLEIGRYTMAKHGRDTHNKPNPRRYALLKSSSLRMDYDGVRNLNYQVKQIVKNRLFTKIIVSYDQEKIINSTKIK